MKPKVIKVKPLPGYRLWLLYNDGAEGEVDLSYLAGKGIFGFWNNTHNFEQVEITTWNALAWSDEIDLCADALYLKLTGKDPEDLFPALKSEKIDA